MNKICPGVPGHSNPHLESRNAFGNDKTRKYGIAARCKKCQHISNSLTNAKRDLSRYTESYARLRFRYTLHSPKWLTKEHKKQIKEIYAERDRLIKETGIPHDVDHIIPIQGETVSGLHVPWNLRPIPSKENGQKKNKWNWETQSW